MIEQARNIAVTTGWPALPLEEWQDTCATLHMWTQIVGKVRLALAPMLNHWWQVPLYVTTRGLTTSPIPHGSNSFEISFDFLDHKLLIQTSNDTVRTLELAPRSVADFYQAFMVALQSLGIDVKIRTMPVEIRNPIPFDRDTQHYTYVPEHAQRFWRVLHQADRVLQRFRCRFLGKASPVHFFWGSFDLAVTRFSGRAAPQHPGGVPNLADWVAQLAYSHEVSSCGFWPGGDPLREAVFYAYAYPEAAGFRSSRVQPAGAYYHDALHEFVLPYDAVRRSDHPDATLLSFAQSTYEAAADSAHWDRQALEHGTPPAHR
jgi:Family of unknown function (DUF5996)